MPKTLSKEKITEAALALPFDEKVELHEALTKQIAIEAQAKKSEGEKAKIVLEKLNGNK